MVFLWIGVAGFLVMAVAAVLGHDGDVDGGDYHFDHDVGGHEVSDNSSSGPSPFSLRTISIFVMVFGFSGFLANFYGASDFISSVIGMAFGIVFAMLAYYGFRMLYAQQGSSTIAIAGLVGQTAEVINVIPEGGVGEVMVASSGQKQAFLARSRDGRVQAGSKVKIVDVLGSNLLVSKNLN
ncbi:MAG: NfeD family protein [Parcubacteria group bacterium]|nr:NfeD family protein [Parcubacteria group bacterium]